MTYAPDINNGNGNGKSTNVDNNRRPVDDIGQKQISFEDVKKYAHADIPIRPLDPNGKPDVSNIFYEGEDSKILYGLSDPLKKWVCENKIRPLKLLAAQPLSPREFWTDERIVRQRWYGIECQTGFNASLSCIVLGIDADKAKPRAILQNLIDNYELSDKTIVQDTPHGGMHLIVKIPCEMKDIAIWRKKALDVDMCRDDCNIEIKTSTMGLTLAPSRHRKDRHLTYAQRGIIGLHEVQPMFYALLISNLKSGGCIRETPEEYHSRIESDVKADFIPLDPNVERYDLTDSEMSDGIDVILGRDDEGIASGSAYVIHRRHNVVKSLGGYLFYHRITLESIRAFIQKLGETAGDSPEDLSNSLKKVEETWKRGINGQPTRGKSGLIEAFARLKDGDQIFGKKRLVLLTKALQLQKIPKHGGGNDADILVKIAEKEIPLFFMNHLNRPCAIVKVQQHYEVMEINTDSFLIALRRMWQSTHPSRITISDDMVKRTRSALIAKSINPELAPIRTHLRVAWKEKNKVLRYDLTNNLWQQVEVSTNDGWKILSSKVMLDEIRKYKESGYVKQKVPVFFQRYSNTKEQVLPVSAESSDSRSGHKSSLRCSTMDRR
jgi:hypothetical protein